MAEELGWAAERREAELGSFRKYLRTMGSNEAISRCEFNALELVDLRNFFDSIDTSNLDEVSFGMLLTQLDSKRRRFALFAFLTALSFPRELKVRYDPNLLASAFSRVQEQNNSKTIDFAGFLDLLFLARNNPGASSLDRAIIQMGHERSNVNGGI